MRCFGVERKKERAAERLVVVHYNVGSRLSQERDVMDVKKRLSTHSRVPDKVDHLGSL